VRRLRHPWHPPNRAQCERTTGATNSSSLFREKDSDGQFCRAACVTGQRYDLIVVDGADRVNCLKQSVEALAPEGVMLLDDSEREAYGEGLAFVRGQGFRTLDFEGLKPIDCVAARTTIFYRRENCLGI
jgi:hypothetical protein